MDKKDLRIVYMGTPDFAVEPLRELVENGYNIVGCITMPDKQAGRGHKVQFSPVKEYALSKNIPLLQPEKLKDEQFLNALREWNADLQIVVAFRMLPEVVWSMPRLGTFNLHASLLPQYRGAAPIQWSVINGDKQTGVTTMFMDEGMDTGDMLLKEVVEIGAEETAGELFDRLSILGAEVLSKTIDKLNSEELIKRLHDIGFKDYINEFTDDQKKQCLKCETIPADTLNEILSKVPTEDQHEVLLLLLKTTNITAKLTIIIPHISSVKYKTVL